MNFWNFTGLHATNAMALPYALGGNNQFNTNDIIVTQVTSFNYPLWYLSGILICSVALYYALAKNEGFFKCIVAPFLSVAFLSAYAFSELNWGNFREGTVLGLPIDVMWVVGGMCIGALLWYFVDFLAKKQLGRKAKIGLTILNMVVSVQFIYMGISNFWTAHMTTGAASGIDAIFK